MPRSSRIGRTGKSSKIDGFSAKGQSFEALIDSLEAPLLQVHAGICRKRERRESRDHRQDGARDCRRRHPLRFASVARQRLRQSRRMATRARSMLLHVLTGSVGTPGGHNLNAWNKFVPRPFKNPPPQKRWNELLYPLEWPLCMHEMSPLLPHFLKEGRGPHRSLFHPSLQSGLDLSRRVFLDRNVA